jgi:Fe-S oxidoreductase
MFMEERAGKRINIERTEEALRLNPKTIATECPFCMTMLSDGVKAKSADEQVLVRDVAEILVDALL